MIPLPVLEEIIDASGAAPRIEAMLPTGVRPRQLSVRTLLAGLCLTQADHRPAHLTRVHHALTHLPEADQVRLGVIAEWKNGPHRLTYRQTERTCGLIAGTLAKDEPDGLPSGDLAGICDDLLEASIPEESKDASASLAVDWTDMESFSRPPPARGGPCADPEASWGHRKNNLLRSEDELFFGYYLSAAIMMPDENGPAVPELARRATLSSCRHDPVRAFAPVLTAMPGQTASVSATSSPTPATPTATPAAWAIPLRAAGARLVQDLHPHDRGPKGTHDGAIIANGNLYCPSTPRPLLELGPLARDASPRRRRRARRPDRRAGPLQARPPHPRRRRRLPPRRLPRRHGQDPLPPPPRLDDPGPGPPGDPQPPQHPQACCTQQTLTVPPGRSPPRPRRNTTTHPPRSAAPTARRTGAERGFATVKDPATSDISRGWCRLMGLAPLMLFTTTLLIVRNQRILAAWNARQEENQRRAANGLPPKTRRRRRKTLASLATGPP